MTNQCWRHNYWQYLLFEVVTAAKCMCHSCESPRNWKVLWSLRSQRYGKSKKLIRQEDVFVENLQRSRSLFLQVKWGFGDSENLLKTVGLDVGRGSNLVRLFYFIYIPLKVSLSLLLVTFYLALLLKVLLTEKLLIHKLNSYI